jgi:hypothetical protein
VAVGRDGGVWMGMAVLVLVGGGARVGVAVGGSCLAQAHDRKRPAPIIVAIALAALK